MSKESREGILGDVILVLIVFLSTLCITKLLGIG